MASRAMPLSTRGGRDSNVRDTTRNHATSCVCDWFVQDRTRQPCAKPLAEWERDLLQPAGTQQSDSSIETASELPHGDVTGEDAGELAEAQDETAS